jgi:hypothetical protein
MDSFTIFLVRLSVFFPLMLAVGMWYYSRWRLGKASWGWVAYTAIASFHLINKNFPPHPDSAVLTGRFIGLVLGNGVFFEVVTRLAGSGKRKK